MTEARKEINKSIEEMQIAFVEKHSKAKVGEFVEVFYNDGTIVKGLVSELFFKHPVFTATTYKDKNHIHYIIKGIKKDGYVSKKNIPSHGIVGIEQI